MTCLRQERASALSRGAPKWYLCTDSTNQKHNVLLHFHSSHSKTPRTNSAAKPYPLICVSPAGHFDQHIETNLFCSTNKSSVSFDENSHADDMNSINEIRKAPMTASQEPPEEPPKEPPPKGVAQGGFAGTYGLLTTAMEHRTPVPQSLSAEWSSRRSKVARRKYQTEALHGRSRKPPTGVDIGLNAGFVLPLNLATQSSQQSVSQSLLRST